MNKLQIKYSEKTNQVVKFANIFIGGIPFVGGVLNSSIGFANEELIKHRLSVLLNELNKGKLDINDDLVKNNDFIHGVTIVFDAVCRTHSEEKILLFANLLSNGIEKNILYL